MGGSATAGSRGSGPAGQAVWRAGHHGDELADGALLRMVAAAFPGGGMTVFDHDLRYVAAGGPHLLEVGLPPEQLVGRTIWEVLPAADADPLVPAFRATLEGHEQRLDHQLAGRIFHIRTAPLRDANGRVVAGFVSSMDVTEDRAREEHLQHVQRSLSRRLAQQQALVALAGTALSSAGEHRLTGEAVATVAEALDAELVGWFDRGGEDEPPLLCDGTGWPPALLGHARAAPAGIIAQTLVQERSLRTERSQDPRFAADPLLDGRGVASTITAPVSTGEGHGGALAAHSRSRGAFDAGDVVVLEAFAALLGAASGRRRAEAQLRQQALRDPLTGLANRAELRDRLSGALERAARGEGRVAVLFLDLDGFKAINDEHGHATGDRILLEVARRLERTVRGGDVVGRLGGDEFVVLCERLDDAEAAVSVAARCAEALEAPYDVAGEPLAVTCSVGVALAHQDRSADQLIDEADQAMYLAKHRRRSRVEVFDQELRGRAERHLRRRAALPGALARGELELRYAPRVATVSGALVGLVGVVVWNAPGEGLLELVDFRQEVEQLGLGHEVHGWALGQALAQLEHWDRQGLEVATLSGSLPVRSLDAEGLARLDQLLAGGVGPGRVQVNLAIDELAQDPTRSQRTVSGLRERGVRVAVEGVTGAPETLGLLAALPVDQVVAARDVVARLGDEPRSQAPLAAVLAGAGALDLPVSAAGVTRREQWIACARLGCHSLRGELIGPPMRGEEVTTVLARGGVASPSSAMAQAGG